MWFDTREYNYIYENFDYGAIRKNTIRYHGDQDYINAQIPHNKLEFFDSTKIISYKWQIKEGGYNFSARKYNKPGEISYPSADADVLIFHGTPNPCEEDHPVVRDNWY